jgi:hypothetical protein
MDAEVRTFLPGASIRRHRPGDEVTMVVADDLILNCEERRAMAALRLLAA